MRTAISWFGWNEFLSSCTWAILPYIVFDYPFALAFSSACSLFWAQKPASCRFVQADKPVTLSDITQVGNTALPQGYRPGHLDWRWHSLLPSGISTVHLCCCLCWSASVRRCTLELHLAFNGVSPAYRVGEAVFASI